MKGAHDTRPDPSRQSSSQSTSSNSSSGRLEFYQSAYKSRYVTEWIYSQAYFHGDYKSFGIETEANFSSSLNHPLHLLPFASNDLQANFPNRHHLSVESNGSRLAAPRIQDRQELPSRGNSQEQISQRPHPLSHFISTAQSVAQAQVKPEAQANLMAMYRKQRPRLRIIIPQSPEDDHSTQQNSQIRNGPASQQRLIQSSLQSEQLRGLPESQIQFLHQNDGASQFYPLGLVRCQPGYCANCSCTHRVNPTTGGLTSEGNWYGNWSYDVMSASTLARPKVPQQSRNLAAHKYVSHVSPYAAQTMPTAMNPKIKYENSTNSYHGFQEHRSSLTGASLNSNNIKKEEADPKISSTVEVIAQMDKDLEDMKQQDDKRRADEWINKRLVGIRAKNMRTGGEEQ